MRPRPPGEAATTRDEALEVAMEVAGVPARISEIRARIAQLSDPSPLTGTAATTTPAGAAGSTQATTGTAFAQVLDAALSAEPGAWARGTQTAAGGWERPVVGDVTSEYGPRWGRLHAGVDIAAATGTPVRAAAGGIVRTASWHGGYGNLVTIDHGDGTSTRYGHNSRLLVKPGERVVAGQPVAEVGSTGRSTGPHLHFEVRVNDRAVDPQPWLRQRGVEL